MHVAEVVRELRAIARELGEHDQYHDVEGTDVDPPDFDLMVQIARTNGLVPVCFYPNETLLSDMRDSYREARPLRTTKED